MGDPTWRAQIHAHEVSSKYWHWNIKRLYIKTTMLKLFFKIWLQIKFPSWIDKLLIKLSTIDNQIIEIINYHSKVVMIGHCDNMAKGTIFWSNADWLFSDIVLANKNYFPLWACWWRFIPSRRQIIRITPLRDCISLTLWIFLLESQHVCLQREDHNWMFFLQSFAKTCNDK